VSGDPYGKGPGGPVDGELVSAYLDGEAAGPERRLVEAALEASADWRDALAWTGAVRSAIRSAPWPDAPPGFWDGVADGVEAGVPGARGSAITGPARPARGRVARRAAVWAAGAAAAAVVAGFLLPGPSRPVSPSVPSYVESHAARASVDDPITQLAPVGVPVSLSP